MGSAEAWNRLGVWQSRANTISLHTLLRIWFVSSAELSFRIQHCRRNDVRTDEDYPGSARHAVTVRRIHPKTDSRAYSQRSLCRVLDDVLIFQTFVIV